MKRREGKILLVAALCVSLGFSALAKSGEKGDCPMKGRNSGGYHHKGQDKDLDGAFLKKAHFLLTHAEEIGLSDSQQEQIENRKYEAKKNIIQKESEIKTVMLDLKQEFGKDEANRNRVNKLIEDKYVLKEEKAKMLVNAYFDIKNVLSAEQKDKAKELWSEKKKEMRYQGREKRMKDYMRHKQGMHHKNRD
ncbi:MAG: hypothetical protein GF333_06955 [Candidatus Omnitrophica bacterium]|nr:hypothetical protein [Candidatus Omnitrophota bacterium]